MLLYSMGRDNLDSMRSDYSPSRIVPPDLPLPALIETQKKFQHGTYCCGLTRRCVCDLFFFFDCLHFLTYARALLQPCAPDSLLSAVAIFQLWLTCCDPPGARSSSRISD